jgi:hypothetical protein
MHVQVAAGDVYLRPSPLLQFVAVPDHALPPLAHNVQRGRVGRDYVVGAVAREQDAAPFEVVPEPGEDGSGW